MEVKNSKLNGIRMLYPNIRPVAKNNVENPTIKMTDALCVSLNTGEMKHHVW